MLLYIVCECTKVSYRSARLVLKFDYHIIFIVQSIVSNAHDR